MNAAAANKILLTISNQLQHDDDDDYNPNQELNERIFARFLNDTKQRQMDQSILGDFMED